MDTWLNRRRWVVSQLSADPMASAPAPLSGFQPNRVDVFWRSEDGSVMDTWWNGREWAVYKVSK
jgi:hypothetical protein